MFILWYIVALLVIIPALLSVYIITKPADDLIVKWQRFRLRYSYKPLKDEDFLYLPRWIPVIRILGCFIIVGSMWVLYKLV